MRIFFLRLYNSSFLIAHSLFFFDCLCRYLRMLMITLGASLVAALQVLPPSSPRARWRKVPVWFFCSSQRGLLCPTCTRMPRSPSRRRKPRRMFLPWFPSVGFHGFRCWKIMGCGCRIKDMYLHYNERSGLLLCGFQTWNVCFEVSLVFCCEFTASRMYRPLRPLDFQRN